MPFVAHGAPPDYMPKAFCCLKVGGKWKLHHYENGEWKRVYTGLPEDATECSPTAELVGGRWRISFIAGGHESDRRIAETTDFTRSDLEFEKSAILETLDTLPTTFQMVGKFTKATYNWAKSGFKLADEAELARRKSICNNCNFWYPTARMGLGKCLKCGCSLAKLKLASESCPIGKW